MKASPLATLVLIFLLPWFLLVDLSSARGLGLRLTPDECGPDHENHSCPSDECCSTKGHCGINQAAWCAPENCLPDYGMCWDSVPPPPPSSSLPSPSSSPPPPPPPPDACGEKYNRSCPNRGCCSTEDHCGSGPAWCAPGHCQPEYGVCWDSVPPPPPSSSPPPPFPPDACGEKYNRSCPNRGCCSTEDHCGSGAAWCDPEHCQPKYGVCWDSVPPPPPSAPHTCGPLHGNQSCPKGECCSIWGYCGSTADYCPAKHCLPDYGTCWDSIPPTPQATHALDDDKADSLVRQVFEKMEAFNF